MGEDVAKSLLKGALTGLLITALLIGGGYWAGHTAGSGVTAKKAQVRYDSLNNELVGCQNSMSQVYLQANVAKSFLSDYDNEISRLTNELQTLQNRYTDSLAVLRKYNNVDAERAIADYYQHRRARQPDRLTGGLTGVDDALSAGRSDGARLPESGKPAAATAGKHPASTHPNGQPQQER